MAFDKLSHAGLHSALTRFGIDDQFVQVIDDIYDGPTFEVRDQQHASAKKIQGSGIRQGCPLSPYLFVIFLSVLLEDVNMHLRTELLAKNISNPYHIFSANHPLLHLEYADDILIFLEVLQSCKPPWTFLKEKQPFTAWNLTKRKPFDSTCDPQMPLPSSSAPAAPDLTRHRPLSQHARQPST